MDINNQNQQYFGELRISVISTIGYIPVVGAAITIAYTKEPENILATATTDSSGTTGIIELTAPAFSLSQEPSEVQPYTDYNITVEAEGYEPVLVIGSEILPDRLSLQLIRMNPVQITREGRIPVYPHPRLATAPQIYIRHLHSFLQSRWCFRPADAHILR